MSVTGESAEESKQKSQADRKMGVVAGGSTELTKKRLLFFPSANQGSARRCLVGKPDMWTQGREHIW